MSRTIITHVGTSIKTKHVDGNTSRESLWNQALKGNTGSRQSLTEKTVNDLDVLWAESEGAQREESSGELASLSLLNLASNDRVVLVHSDSDEGRLAACLLREVMLRFDKDGFPGRTNANLCVQQIEGMKVPDSAGTTSSASDRQEFVRDGLVNYVHSIWDLYMDCLDRDDIELIFNITGGYKGMVPVARDLALLLTDHHASQNTRPLNFRLCYLFEGSNDLIWYDSYPITLNWDAAASAAANPRDPMSIVLGAIHERMSGSE